MAIFNSFLYVYQRVNCNLFCVMWYHQTCRLIQPGGTCSANCSGIGKISENSMCSISERYLATNNVVKCGKPHEKT